MRQGQRLRQQRSRKMRETDKERQQDIREKDRACTCTMVYKAMHDQSPADSQWPPSASRAGRRSVDQTQLDEKHTAKGATRTR